MSELTVVRKIEDVTRDIKIKTGQFLLDAIEIGRLLFEAKAMVETGKWSQYIAEELPFSHSWANNYMRLYKELGQEQLSLFGDSQTLGNLRPTQALELLAIPAEERAEFLEENNVAEMSTRELRQAIRERDDAKKALEEAEARAEEAKLQAEKQIMKLKSDAEDDKRVSDANKSRADAAEQARQRAEIREKEAWEKVESLKKELVAANDKMKKLKENPVVPEDVMCSMQQEAEEAAVKKAAAELQKKVDAAEAVAQKAAQEREAAETSAREAQEKLDKLQKSARISDPDLMAVQVLGQQILQNWNVILGHRKKAVTSDGNNAGPLDAFLRKLVETMLSGIGGEG